MIYVDNAATTRLSDRAFEAMLPYLKENYGNASTLYKLGRDNHRVIEKCRKDVSKIIHAKPNEIYFTSGGTESDNWALKGVLYALKETGKNHLITTCIEHPAVLNTAKALEKEGFEVTYLSVDHTGLIDLNELEKSIKENTALVSIMYANNEIGTIEPIEAIGSICKKHQVYFHTDAVQAMGTLEIDVESNHIDLLSVSAHKFYGPKGIGFLYVKKNVPFVNILEGGHQEKGHRPGTENVASIVGMVEALKEAYETLDDKVNHIALLRNKIEKALLEMDGVSFNGNREHRLPGTLNVSFDNVDGQSLLFELDLKGICASSGSACSSGNVDPSHVLLAIGVPYVKAHGSLRISLGKYNTLEEMDVLIQKIKEAVEYVRKS